VSLGFACAGVAKKVSRQKAVNTDTILPVFSMVLSLWLMDWIVSLMYNRYVKELIDPPNAFNNEASMNTIDTYFIKKFDEKSEFLNNLLKEKINKIK